MTFDDDFIRIEFLAEAKTLRCKDIGLSWPPPEAINIEGFTYRRARYSLISDEQRAAMTQVCRGAVYEAAQ